MNVDTGQFAAIRARADSVDALTAEVSRLAGIAEALSAAAAQQFIAGTFVELGRELERQETAGQQPGRHARPRRAIPGYLRLMSGGAQ